MADELIGGSGIEVTYGARAGLLGGRPGLKVLHGVDIAIRRGETVGIVGESGSGKSTLGRALLRLVDISAGTIRFAGEDIAHRPEAALRPLRRRMQMIFQDPMASLNPRHTVRQILRRPMILHGVAGDAAGAEGFIRAMAARVGLPEAALGRHPHELSGGQRQRVGIARAALLQPDFVVADEIVSGLDVSTQAEVLRLLKDLTAETGLAMAFISHDLSVIRALCDRVVVMRLGRIVEEGTCESVFAAPREAYTRQLIDAIPLPEIDSGWLDREAPALPSGI